MQRDFYCSLHFTQDTTENKAADKYIHNLNELNMEKHELSKWLKAFPFTHVTGFISPYRVDLFPLPLSLAYTDSLNLPRSQKK
jgi:hypothetical protein